MDMVLRQHITVYGPQLENQAVSQYLIPPSDHSVNVPYLSWYIEWASDSYGNYVDTGYPNSTGQYLPIFWDRNYDDAMVMPTVTILPAVFYDYHEHVTYMHHVISHIPFDTATSLIDNAILNDMNGTEKNKYDSDNDMNMSRVTK